MVHPEPVLAASEPAPTEALQRPRRGVRAALAIAAAWVMSLAADVVLHAGVLARFYAEPRPFLLAPDRAFRRIPLGYLAFLVLTTALYWLLRRLDVRSVGAGMRYGALGGLVVWGAFAAGLYSISTIDWPVLAGWWIGQAVELGLAGAVLGAAAAGRSMRRIWAVVGVAVCVCVAATIAMQSLGWAPPMKAVR